MDVRNPWRRARRVVVVTVVAVGAVAATAVAKSLSESQHTVTLEYPDVASSTAVCAGGRHVGFGGFFTDTGADQSPYAFVTGSAPAGKDVDRWKVSGYNATAFAKAKLKSYAYCFKGKKPTVKKKTVTIPGNATDGNGTSAVCPKSRTLIGGGFFVKAPPASGSGNFILHSLDRTANKRGIELTVVNEKASAVDVTAYAVCGSGKKAVETSDTKRIKHHTRGSATARCPGNKKALFGGFKAQYKDDGLTTNFRVAVPEAMSMAGKNGIEVTALGLVGDGGRANLTAVAYCR